MNYIFLIKKWKVTMILIWRYVNAYKVKLLNAFLEKILKHFSSILDFEPLSGPEYWPEVTVWAIYNPIYIIVGCLHSNNTNCSIAISQNITFKLLRGIYFSMFFHWSLIPPLIRGSKSEQSPEKACIEVSQMEYGKFKDHFSTIDIR